MSPTIETLEPRPILGIRTHVKLNEIGNTIGELLQELMPYVGANAAGAPLARYHTWENDDGQIEVAVPVREPAAGEGRIVADNLPGGRAAVVMHVGPYDGLKETWEALRAWLEEQGHESRDAPWEEYLSDPTQVPPEKLETRVVWPIEG